MANRGFYSTRKVGRDLVDSYLSIEDRKEFVKDKSADALISLHIGSKNNTIKIYTNEPSDSVALGCNVLNELIKVFKINDTAIIPVNFDLIPKNDEKQILNIDKPAILIELGDSSEDFILEKREEIVSAIEKGVNYLE